jgi:hydroxymethylglutaryl-CoA synthase
MKTKGVGLVSFAAVVPKDRIKTEEIAAAWGKPLGTGKSLGIVEKAVIGSDQDTATLAVDAAQRAVGRYKDVVNANSSQQRQAQQRPQWQQPLPIGAIYTGSESHPYAVKSTSAIVGESLQIGNSYTAADLEFACKAGTAGVQAASGLVAAGMTKMALAIGADVSQSRPGDALEYSAASAGAAFLLAGKSYQENWLAELVYTTSFTSETPDFWRREHQVYPSHGGRFTGEPAYFRHIEGALAQLFTETKLGQQDFDHVILHMPNGRFPKQVAAKLGFSASQMEAGFTVPFLGNSYSACSLVGLVGALEVAKKGQCILLCSYGSGSGSDAFVIEVKQDIAKLAGKSDWKRDLLAGQIARKDYVSYPTYLQRLHKILK